MGFKRADLDFANLDFGYRKTDANIRYTFKNGNWDSGQLYREDDFQLSIAATCLHYGQAVFEGLKVFETKSGEIAAFRPIENCKRMAKSAEKLFMEPVPEELFLDALNRVVKENRRFIPPYGTNSTLYVRPLLIGASAHIGIKPSNEYIFLMLVTPVGPYFKGGVKPVKMMVVDDLDRAAPYGVGDVKAAGNYAAGLRGSFRAKQNGYTDVIYLDTKHRKYIDESGPANFIAIMKDDTYVTPESSSVLPSITNMSLREIAEKDFGWKVEQRLLSIDEIDNFAEAGCCGTAAVVSPVGEILYNGKIYKFYDEGKSAGPKITKLYKRLTDIQWGEIEDKNNWLYKINVD